MVYLIIIVIAAIIGVIIFSIIESIIHGIDNKIQGHNHNIKDKARDACEIASTFSIPFFSGWHSNTRRRK